MRDRQGGVRWAGVGITTVAAIIGCLVLLLVWRRAGGDLPTLPWLALAPLLILSAVVLVAGWQVRGSVRPPGGPGGPGGTGTGSQSQRARTLGGRPRTPGQMTPQRARGTLVAAQASALGGAVLVGWYLANAFLAAPDADVPSVRSLLFRALVSAAGALVLVVCGMVTQSCCRVPPSDDDDEGRGEAPGRGRVPDPLPE